MKAMKYKLFFLAIPMLISGCSEDDRLLFDQTTSVYFNNSDSLEYTFAFEPEAVSSDTIYLDFRITGMAVDVDREIGIETDSLTTAKAGYHFDIVNPVIPAGTYEASVPVVLYRRPGLVDSVVTAYLRIVDSPDLLAGYDDAAWSWPVLRAKYSRRRFKFTVTDQLNKPAIWDSFWMSFFGDYSRVKLRFLAQATGYTNWNAGVYLPQDRNFMIQAARYALYEYEQANGPMLDENGNRVVFP
ncbi:DUF4843 domain-containing protein [Parapedobacter sp. 10938]|uniref:DUF4843 domain-containing protein n=1 Tax=Parapedobacter flavus TaxID=3110225 RepID=UPI002DBB790E|nr:DUF4843 domain-containing protein [Parapedobacter sp. 10938]MEC3878237.1 DUF4843 domain-containing protein [Parapedobacter sp. 10938]